jgi:hypothetical protein
MEQIWTFIQTLGKGIVQGFNQYVDNDLRDHIPLFVIAAVLLLFVLVKKIIERFKNNKR